MENLFESAEFVGGITKEPSDTKVNASYDLYVYVIEKTQNIGTEGFSYKNASLSFKLMRKSSSNVFTSPINLKPYFFNK